MFPSLPFHFCESLKDILNSRHMWEQKSPVLVEKFSTDSEHVMVTESSMFCHPLSFIQSQPGAQAVQINPFIVCLLGKIPCFSLSGGKPWLISDAPAGSSGTENWPPKVIPYKSSALGIRWFLFIATKLSSVLFFGFFFFFFSPPLVVLARGQYPQQESQYLLCLSHLGHAYWI